MSLRAKRSSRRSGGFQAYYRSAAWRARREAIRQRAHGRCEFCASRAMQHVHHRTYASFRHEPLAHLMAVCRVCHRSIHGRGRKGTCAAGSLMAQGDPGLGLSSLWVSYLRHVERIPEEGRLWKGVAHG